MVVWSWDDIAEALFHRIELLRTIFPKYWPTYDRLEKLPPQRISVTRLPRSADRLFGREARLAQLAAAWTEKKLRVLTLVAWGGVGKTSLVAKFADTLLSAASTTSASGARGSTGRSWTAALRRRRRTPKPKAKTRSPDCGPPDSSTTSPAVC